MTPEHYDETVETVRRIPGGEATDYRGYESRTPAQKAQDDILDQAETAVASASEALATALGWVRVIDPAIAAKYEGLGIKVSQFGTDLADLRKRRG